MNLTTYLILDTWPLRNLRRRGSPSRRGFVGSVGQCATRLEWTRGAGEGWKPGVMSSAKVQPVTEKDQESTTHGKNVPSHLNTERTPLTAGASAPTKKAEVPFMAPTGMPDLAVCLNPLVWILVTLDFAVWLLVPPIWGFIKMIIFYTKGALLSGRRRGGQRRAGSSISLMQHHHQLPPPRVTHHPSPTGHPNTSHQATRPQSTRTTRAARRGRTSS